ncbi:hypothetical protein GBAR_LOCUS17461 [Geodia barretti]|uniref:Uncharacterized protein n=1 Tax=Geodia barretti TaxID=519541 RepID=A0AA35RW47_GEOBA|nr:hypothetical protein GBAR_LOCUS11383 [Geodia barretti]CAI8030774.1 hypothetical protein GBAR_LOCUS17461 [Geodia barretti]
MCSLVSLVWARCITVPGPSYTNPLCPLPTSPKPLPPACPCPM